MNSEIGKRRIISSFSLISVSNLSKSQIEGIL